MATKIKFPYTMHCPKCKTGLKIKSPKLVGTRINCPKCKARIEVVTPDEDGMNPYGVEPPPEPEAIPEPTEEELLDKEKEKKRQRLIAILHQVRFWFGILVLLAMIGGGGYVIYTYGIRSYMDSDKPVQGEKKEMPAEFRS